MSVSTQLCRFCKIINAAAWWGAWPSLGNNRYSYANRVRVCRYRAIYISHRAAYISLHVDRSRALFGDPQPQSSAPQANGRFEPPSRAGSRTLVPERGILRRSRFGASEVRDVAPCAHRGGRQDGGRRTFRRIATDVLSSRSGLRTRGLKRTAPQAPRSQRRAQAHARSDAVCRAPHCWGRSSGRPSTRPTDRSRTGRIGPPSQHRTRSGAQKKTITSGNSLPTAAVSLYEKLRDEVLRGAARPDGLGAFVYHGMLDGLALLMSVTATTTHQPLLREPSLRGDRELVSLLANMVLQAHSEVKHVY